MPKRQRPDPDPVGGTSEFADDVRASHDEHDEAHSVATAQSSPIRHRVVFSFYLNDVLVSVGTPSVIEQPVGGLPKVNIDAVPLWACFYPSSDTEGAQVTESTNEFRQMELAVCRAFPVALCSGIRVLLVDMKKTDKPTVLIPHPLKRTVTLNNGGHYCIGTFVRGDLVMLQRASEAERHQAFRREKAEAFATTCTATDTEAHVVLRRGLRRFLETLRRIVEAEVEEPLRRPNDGGSRSTGLARSSAAPSESVTKGDVSNARDAGHLQAWCAAQRTLAARVGGLLLHGVETLDWRDGPTACAALVAGLKSFHQLPSEDQRSDLCQRALLRARIRLAT